MSVPLLNISFEDFQNALMEVRNYNKDNNCAIEINALRRFIKEQFHAAYNLLYPDQSSSISYNLKIILDGKLVPGSTLASFHTVMSTPAVHYFNSYLPYALEEYDNHLKGEDALCKNVWIHELSHSADFQQLNQGHNWLNELFVKNVRITEKHRNNVYDTLRLMFSFRAEGIATFIEDLFDNGNQFSELWIQDEQANKMFNLSMISNFYDHNVENREAANINMFPYSVGKHLILNSLYYKYPQFRKILTKATLKTKNRENININDFKGIDILHLLFDLSLEEMIFVHLQQNTGLPLDVSLPDAIMHLISDSAARNGLQENNYQETDFQLLQFNNNQDINMFKNQLKNIIGYPMPEEEINKGFELFKNSSLTDQIFSDLLTKKYNEWQETKSELSALQLTYVFDDYDLIEDKLPFFGLIDDMLVLSRY